MKKIGNKTTLTIKLMANDCNIYIFTMKKWKTRQH